MKLAILGATGQTGSHLLQLALDQGHSLTVLIRDPQKLDVEHDRLRVVAGDALESSALEEAVEGAEAVISVMGQTKGSPPDLLTRVADALVPVMEARGITRLVTLTGAGVHDDRDHPPSLGRKFMLRLMRLVARHILEDATGHAERVRASKLNYTIVRPPRLVNGSATGQYDTGYLVMGPGNSITRADLAAFMLAEAVKPSWHREAPMITN